MTDLRCPNLDSAIAHTQETKEYLIFILMTKGSKRVVAVVACNAWAPTGKPSITRNL